MCFGSCCGRLLGLIDKLCCSGGCNGCSGEMYWSEWHNDPDVASQLYNLLESKGITNILVDTAGRRDLMHMRMTTPTPFIRWVGANHETDRQRLDEWVERLAKWKKRGMRKLYFFVHQNVEEESPLLAAHFIEKLNKALKIDLKIPESPNQPK